MIRGFFSALGLLCLLASGLPAAEGGAELIIVTPFDGKVVSGELIRADAAKVVLKSIGDAPQELSFPWSGIKRLSNGLTREKAIAAIQADPEKRCPVCNGKAVTACKKCAGTGRLANMPKIQCPVCGGQGLAKCLDCKEGKAPCPGHCLKLSEGKWEKGDENLLWRKFYYGNSYYSWSQRHLGEVVEYENGKPVNKGKCPKCGGTTTIECLHCKATGKITCPECKGDKEVFPVCPDCKNGLAECAACKGTGMKP